MSREFTRAGSDQENFYGSARNIQSLPDVMELSMKACIEVSLVLLYQIANTVGEKCEVARCGFTGA